MLEVFDQNSNLISGNVAKAYIIKRYESYLNLLKAPYGMEFYLYIAQTNDTSQYLKAIEETEKLLEKLNNGYYDEKA